MIFQVIQRPQSLDLHLYLNTHDKVKQFVRSTLHEESSVGTIDDQQKRPIGYVSIVSLSSTIPTDTTTRPKFGLASKSHHRTVDYGEFVDEIAIQTIDRLFFLEKSFNEDDEYVEEEEVNSELEDSDPENSNKNKQQKFNPNLIRNKIIKIFKRKPHSSTTTSTGVRNPTITHPTNLSHRHPTFLTDRHSDLEEDPPSDISDSTIPVDQWSIESVPKPGFTPFEHLQTLKFVSERRTKPESIFCLN